MTACFLCIVAGESPELEPCTACTAIMETGRIIAVRTVNPGADTEPHRLNGRMLLASMGDLLTTFPSMPAPIMLLTMVYRWTFVPEHAWPLVQTAVPGPERMRLLERSNGVDVPPHAK
jgi:hypothetical protein